MHRFPKLHVGGRATHAFELLRRCAEPDGQKPLAPPHKIGYRFPHPHYKASARLLAIGWIEERNSGPRGGKRWHATEVGLAALSLAQSMKSAAEPVIHTLFGNHGGNS